MIYSFEVSNLNLSCVNQRKYIVSDSVQFHKAHFVFDSQWNGYAKTIIFKNSKTKKVVNQTLLDPQNPTCDIPWESIDSEGYLIVCAYGVLGTSEIYTVMPNPLLIVKSDKAIGTNPADPTPSVYEQIIDMLSNIGGIYTLPTATDTILGGIKIGAHLSIDVNGVVTVNHASQSSDGLMSSLDKIKLDGIIGDVDVTPNTYVIRDENADINTNGVDFDLTPSPPTIPIGHLQWSPTYMTLSLGTKEDSTLELGQEIVFPIRNGSGSTMPNGTVCYWYEAIGASGRVRVAPFIANGTIIAERCLGIVTHNLTTNEDGHSTWLGSVNGINTTGSLYGETWIDGDIIYASPTIVGGMTNVKPTYPNIAIRLGVVILAHATQGQLATKTIIYPTADQVYVSDVNNYYASTDTNSIFDEIGNKLTTLFDDLPPAPFLTAKTGSAIPTLVTFSGNIKQYTFAVNDEIFGTSEVTHLYKNGTDLMPHIHWTTNGTDTTNRYVKWEMEYSYAKLDGTFSTPTVISTEATIVANTGNRTHYMTNLPIISGTNITVGTYLCWRVRRIASTGTAPTSNPFGLALGIHVHQSVLK